MWWFVFAEVLFLRSKEHPVVSFLSLIIHGCPYFLRTPGTPSNCCFKSSPVALLHTKVHLTGDIKTACTRWKCFSFCGRALATAIWGPWWQVISACARALCLQHCHLGFCCFNCAVALTSQAGQLGALTRVDLWSENPWTLLVCGLQQRKFKTPDGANLQSADQTLPLGLLVPLPWWVRWGACPGWVWQQCCTWCLRLCCKLDREDIPALCLRARSRAHLHQLLFSLGSASSWEIPSVQLSSQVTKQHNLSYPAHSCLISLYPSARRNTSRELHS